MTRFLAYAAAASLFLLSLSPVARAQEAPPPSEPLHLGDVLQHVYAHNPTLNAARAELEKTRELHPQAMAGWLPTLNAQSSIYASHVESSNFGSGDGATTKEYGLDLEQPIFRGGITTAETARAEDAIKAGESTLRQAGQRLVLDATVTFMNVVRDRELLTLRTQNENVLHEELRAARERFDQGELTQTDVRQTQARLARAQAKTYEAAGNLRASESRFEQIVGYRPTQALKIPAKNFGFPELLDDMVAMAESRNPDIFIATHQQQAAEHNIDATLRELYPQISAFASYNKQHDPQPGIVDESETEIVGLRATLALYQGGRVRSRVREAKSEAMKKQYEIEETRRRLRQEVTANWSSYQTALAEMRARKTEVESADLALQGVREESRLGQRTVLDVLDADQELIEAKAALATARRNDIVSAYALASSLGLLVPANDHERSGNQSAE